MEISQISVKLIFHSFSDSSTFGRPGLGRSTPLHQMAISQIPALIWELIFGRPPVKWQISQIPVKWHISFRLWELNIWQTKSWHSYHPPQRQFHRFLLYSESSSFGRPSVLAYLPPIQWWFHRFLFWQLTFDDSSYFIPTLRAQHLADEVLTDLPPFFEWQFHWFLLYSDNSYLADQVLAHLPPIKYWFHRWLFIIWQINMPGISTSPSNSDFIDSCSDSSLCACRATLPFGTDFTGDCVMGCNTAPAHLPLEWQIHRFLLWQLIFHSYSESSSFGRPSVLVDLPPVKWWFHRFLWNSDFIPALTAHHLAWPGLGIFTPI